MMSTHYSFYITNLALGDTDKVFVSSRFSVQQVGNLGLLFMLLFFIYAALGVELFGELGKRETVSQYPSSSAVILSTSTSICKTSKHKSITSTCCFSCSLQLGKSE